jgi:hypothetical protein
VTFFVAGVSETGKKKRASEASRLLDDEGVIHMLNRVPSVYGMLPPGPSHSNLARVQRARYSLPLRIFLSINQ